MLKRSCSGAVLLMLSSAVLLGSAACNLHTTTNSAAKSVESPPVAPVTPVAKPIQPSTAQAAATSLNSYKLALEKADSAGNITVSAQSRDDWTLVASRWQQAIQLMRSIPGSSPYRSLAQAKLNEYRRNFAYAKNQAIRAGSTEIASEPTLLPISPPTNTTADSQPERVVTTTPRSGRVYVAKIKRRAGGTPVIDVRFNGNRTFEMIVDTGASGTVITNAMASTLGVNVIGKAKVDTASERDVEVPLAYVNSMAVGGAVVKGVVVAIGNSALDTGLLGHDFFDGYDVTIKRDVVEFRQQ